MTASSAPQPQPGLSRLVRVGGSLAIALAIILGAWFVSGREGLNNLGKAGMNYSALPAVGTMAPDFAVPDADGNMHTLSEYRGQPVWINFWGSWCPPCRAEMPDTQAAYEVLQPQGVVLLAISRRESASDAENFAALNHATFPILSDPIESLTGQSYPLANFPTHIFINRDGTINRIVLSPLSEAQAVEYAQEIINS
jgi:peroxiredoxin